MRAVAPLALSVALVACGARTGLSVDAPAHGMDASLDGGRDAGAPRLESGSDACPLEAIELRVTPTVIVLVDQSASMDTPTSDGLTRWELLRRSLIGSDGIVTRLDARIRFGLSLYSARSALGNDGGPPIGACPLLTTVSPALDNLDRIRATYADAVPIEDTPTGDAIDETRARLAGSFSPAEGPTIFVLATDGEPDRCEELDPQNGQEEAIDAARRAFDAGVRTFVISLADEELSRRHLQDMANAGAGRLAGDAPARFWEARDVRALRTALDDIVRTEVACVLTLGRSVDPERACAGMVLLNDRPLVCDDPDGYRPVDATRIELDGAACEELTEMPDSTVQAFFPCDAP